MRNRLSYCLLVLLLSGAGSSTTADIIYRNPGAYTVEYCVELYPDPNEIDRSRDLRLWVPIPREWPSQKAVRIISVEPKPHAEYTDPEHGNRMLFWDFRTEPAKPCYDVTIKYRVESYEVYAEVDPNKTAPYDKTSKEYQLYTRSTQTVAITPEIREFAKQAVGAETNPYAQARRIFEFVRKRMRYKILDHERGRGIACLLDHPVRDEEAGGQYYEGCCSQYSAFFCALCRAAGIPARAVFAFKGRSPWIEGQPLRPLYRFETKLSPDGLAGVQHFGSMYPHMWAEFLLPDYGWIPVDAQTGRFGSLDNRKVILNKGRDVLIGPHAPQEQHEGYGSQWVPLHDGRADYVFSAVWNISKIHNAKVKARHSCDPFPAEALAGYAATLYPKAEADVTCAQYRKLLLAALANEARGQSDQSAAFRTVWSENIRLRYRMESFLCHMLREVVGDKHFFNMCEAYVDERVRSGAAVTTERFKEIADKTYGRPLDWFWSQWLDRHEPPQLELHDVHVSEAADGWRMRGTLSQAGPSIFRLPVELELRTDDGAQRTRVWLTEQATTFQFDAAGRPEHVLVDPDYDILTVRKLPPLLSGFWDVWPNYVVIYGTVKDAEANKAAAERFRKNYLGIEQDVVRADVDVNDADMKDKCVFLFGRPETNRIARRLERAFPIRFEGPRFPWQGKTYDTKTHGVAQIVEDPNNPKQSIILYAGLSGEAMSSLAESGLYDAGASYVIFDREKELTRGDWLADGNLVWTMPQDDRR